MVHKLNDISLRPRPNKINNPNTGDANAGEAKEADAKGGGADVPGGKAGGNQKHPKEDDKLSNKQTDAGKKTKRDAENFEKLCGACGVKGHHQQEGDNETYPNINRFCWKCENHGHPTEDCTTTHEAWEKRVIYAVEKGQHLGKPYLDNRRRPLEGIAKMLPSPGRRYKDRE